MNKILQNINFVAYAILLCILIFNSCKRDAANPDCSQCQITQQELALLPSYNKGDISIFKNDATSEIDTLNITSKSAGSPVKCFERCSPVDVNMSIWGVFLHNAFSIGVAHSSTSVSPTPGINFDGTNVNFHVSGTTQSMAINSTIYNDVVITSIDSTKIPSVNRDQIPWKIDYSKSKGFIRFYMLNGQTWSKL